MSAIRILVVVLMAYSQSMALPKPVSACLARHPDLTFNDRQTPPYLQLFFTTAENPDYVVAVRERHSNYNRALVCMYDGKDVVLGARTGTRPFSDMKNDNYMSSDWRVCTRNDVAGLRQYYKDVPEPVNQAVCLTWEDAEGLVYWDGKRFRWKSLWP